LYGLFGPFGVEGGGCTMAANNHFVSCDEMTLLPSNTLFGESLSPGFGTGGQRIIGEFTGPGADLRLEFHY